MADKVQTLSAQVWTLKADTQILSAASLDTARRRISESIKTPTL